MDPSGHDLAELSVAIGIGGILNGLVSGVTASASGGNFFDGFSRGLISGTVSTALLLGAEIPPSYAFAIGNAAGDIAVDLYEHNYNNPEDAAFSILKTVIDISAGGAFGSLFNAHFEGLAAADSASILQAVLYKQDSAALREAAVQLAKAATSTGITGVAPAFIGKLVDLVRDVADYLKDHPLTKQG